MGAIMDSLNGWRDSKTISQTNLFDVTFDFSNINLGATDSDIVKAFNSYTNSCFGPTETVETILKQIKPWHVTSVNVPMNLGLQKVNQAIGVVPNTFPVFAQTDGYEIAIDFEDDKDLTIAKFLQYMFMRCVRADGVHWPPALNKSVGMTIRVFDKSETVKLTIKCLGVYLLDGGGALNFSYAQNDSMKYSAKFNCDEITYEYQTSTTNEVRPTGQGTAR